MRSKILMRKIIQWIDTLNNRASYPDVEIVVEGARDIEALRGIGIRGKFTLASLLLREIKNEGYERVNDKTFIILTDFDKEGISLYKKLKRTITELGGRIDDFPRKQYASLKFPPLIEELESFTRRRVENWDYLRIQ